MSHAEASLAILDECGGQGPEFPQHDYYSLLAFFQGVTPNGYANPNVEQPIFAGDAAHLALASHDLSRQHFGHFVEGNFVPAMQPDAALGHVG